MHHVAEGESEAEEKEEVNRSGDDAKEPRDSGCFESSDNLENGREEPKTEEQTSNEGAEKPGEDEEDKGEKEEQPTEQLEVIEEQLKELTVDEGCWEVTEKLGKNTPGSQGLCE